MLEDSLIVERGEDGKRGLEGENTEKTYTVQKISDKQKVGHTHTQFWLRW